MLRLAVHDVVECCLSFAPLGLSLLIRSLCFMVIFGFTYFALQTSGLLAAFSPFSVTCAISLFLFCLLSCVFEYFASQWVFGLSFSHCLPITLCTSLVCLLRSSFASQTMVLCGTFLSPFFRLLHAYLALLFSKVFFLFCQLCRTYFWPLSSAIPLMPIFSSLFFFLHVSSPDLAFVEFNSLYSRCLPSLRALRCLWENGKVMWSLRGRTAERAVCSR